VAKTTFSGWGNCFIIVHIAKMAAAKIGCSYIFLGGSTNLGAAVPQTPMAECLLYSNIIGDGAQPTLDTELTILHINR